MQYLRFVVKLDFLLSKFAFENKRPAIPASEPKECGSLDPPMNCAELVELQTQTRQNSLADLTLFQRWNLTWKWVVFPNLKSISLVKCWIFVDQRRNLRSTLNNVEKGCVPSGLFHWQFYIHMLNPKRNVTQYFAVLFYTMQLHCFFRIVNVMYDAFEDHDIEDITLTFKRVTWNSRVFIHNGFQWRNN